MNKSLTDRRSMIRRMAAVAVFCAVAYACQYVFRIHVFFLTFDAMDAVMAIGAMLFGPLWGLVITLVVASIEALSISSGTGWIGWIMNVLSSATFVCVSAVIYRYKRTMLGAILGLFTGVLSTVSVMLVLNLLLTPLYTGKSVKEIAAMIPTLLLPFNLTKSLLNAGLVLVLYKPISTAMKNARVIKGEPTSLRFDRKSVLMLIIGVMVIAACVTAFLLFMNGQFEWG